jgi:hypothetical protein
LTIFEEGPLEDVGFGAKRALFSGAAKKLNHREFVTKLKELVAAGYVLEQSEWHHSEYDDDDGKPTSVFHVVLHIKNDTEQTRHIFDGKLEVVWNPVKDERGEHQPKTMTFKEL